MLLNAALNFTQIAKLFALLGLSATKFFLAPSLIIYAGYTFWETIAISCTGGIIGFLTFFKFGIYLKSLLKKVTRKKRKLKNNKRNRRFVRLKNTYGLYWIAILTPCLFSIPIGAFLASAYFSKKNKMLPLFIGSIVIWAFILTYSSTFIFK